MRWSILALLVLFSASGARAATAFQAPPDGLMVSSIDPSIDPCQDFYEHACHGWLAANPIPPDESSWDVGAPLTERNNEILRTILERAAADQNPETRKIGDYWAACMDEPAIEQAGLSPLRGELDRIDQVAHKADLAPLIGYLHRIGVNVLFSLDSTQDYHDASRVIGEIDQGGLGLPDRDYYLRRDRGSKATRTAYLGHLGRMAALAGAIPVIARHEAAASFRLETALARVSLSDEDRTDPHRTYHDVTPASLVRLAPGFNWTAYFASAGAPPLDHLNLAVPGFVSGMQRLIAITPLADIKSYLRLQLIGHAAELLPAPFGDEVFRFFGVTLRGTKSRRPRWKRCVALVDEDLGEDLGRVYVRERFGPDAKASIQVLTANLRAAFADDLATIPWMGPETRSKAEKKLAAMVEKIGYPDHWRDYAALRIDRNDALGNLFRAADFELERELDKIGKPTDRGEWAMTPPTVNAYYDDQKNDINFPAGNLQPPYFDKNWDNAINYGAIGATIGHEMTHGFDNSGRMFDATGNLRNWWTQTDAQAFEARAQCLVNEYDGFEAVPGVHLNGRTTLGENTADNGGTRLAYAALTKASGDGPDPRVDGYTPAQRFFLAYAQSFCENQTEAGAKLQAQTDPHATARYRVNGVLQNMPEFRRAFACHEGTAMAPKKMCRVW